uniref:C2H2-type domain-containing protein n=1 Tax=Setaria viridis TaxID=4556 RepID=A0A4U6VIC2_SETVI|nr:hypothetical protein SEVIR_3G392000v2 [Setaria viridis]
MAVGGGPRLLAAAWIFAAAAASLPLEQAGRSQKSINCMPCSRTYIGDAYLHTLTDHAHHRGLAEMSDSDELCEGLTDDVEVPTLSELQRQLVGEVEKLPNGVFADPFELQHFVERKVFLDVAVFGDTNLELPSALSNRSAVEIHFDLRPSTLTNCNIVIDLPLHARYPER